MIVLIHAPEPEFVKEASKRGVFAYITDADGEDWQSSIDIVLRRFAEYHDLEGAFGRRAVTERAKGILMERHSIDETARLPDAARPRPRRQPQAGRRRVGRGRRPPRCCRRAKRPGSRREPESDLLRDQRRDRLLERKLREALTSSRATYCSRLPARGAGPGADRAGDRSRAPPRT